MPFINVKIAGPTLAPEQIGRLQRGLTDIVFEALRKERELTSVLIEQVPASRWSIAGAVAPVLAHVTASVAAGSNTVEERARFIAETHRLLKLILGGGLPMATYVIVDEPPDDSWGYDGITHLQRAKSAHHSAA
ncbi:tautomerase family protein [Caballeronia sp. LjRoot29]|jgi:4-oxalocrotonate tautomerase|uniref:tautomerase family protein n=1 Tax=unclassified Caballeronia TaxID=2646786 RepID=UPI0039E6852A